MKTTSLFFLGVFALSSFFSFGQNVAQTASLTSGGSQAGPLGSSSAYYGYQAGKISTGLNNTFIGHLAGKVNTSGMYSTFIGSGSGQLSTGSGNTFVGSASGYNNTTGFSNTFLGRNSGSDNLAGTNNCYIGFSTGSKNLGSSNVFIGSSTGPAVTSTISNMLMIDNISTLTPLIWGDFTTTSRQLKLHGKVGIGGNSTTAFGNFPSFSGSVSVSAYNLFVKGGILTDEVRVSTTWADYVFAKEYQLPTLQEVEKHIQEKGHLINVPSAKQVQEDGIELGEMAKIQQEKIEELTLYIIAQNKMLLELTDRLTAIEKR